MTDRYACLRAAVNLDLPPLPWHAPGLAELHDADDVCVAYFSDCEPVEQERRPVPSINEGDRFARYVVAANPQAIRALLADYDRMRDALIGAVAVAREAHAHWDAVRDAKLGKLLLALSGYEPGYDPRTDAVQAALAQEQGGSDGDA